MTFMDKSAVVRRCRRRLAVPLFALFAVAALAPAGHAAGPQRYALLIGVGSYEQWTHLENPVPDVRALAAELRRRYGFLPEVLENPDREEILAKLRRYAGLDCGAGDQLVIVFAGHGNYDEVTGIGYLAARDSASRTRDPTFDTLIDYPRLLTMVDRMPCGEVLLVVDACFSGSLENERLGSGGTAAVRLRRYLTAGGTEYVPDGDPDGHSPLMGRLLAGLRSTPAGGRVSLEAIHGEHMAALDPRPRYGSFGGDAGNGRFVLRAVGQSTAGTPATARPAVARVPAPEPASRLRAAPRSVSPAQLKRTLAHHDLADLTWNPDGDFPNQFRTQDRDMWAFVVDLESGLVWQQGGSEYRMSRQEAEAYVARLNAERHGGHGDWRLPTLEELATLVEPDRQMHGLHLSTRFAEEQESCWSSDRDRGTGDPYYVSFGSGRIVLAYGTKKAFVRAVHNQ